MNTGMMQSLIGAGNSIKTASVSMNVYMQARNKGDEETMQRALGYTMEHMEQAEKYGEKLEEATKEDQKEAAKKAEKEKAEALAEKKVENQMKKEQMTQPSASQTVDEVLLSEEAKQYIEQQVELAVKSEVVTDVPKVYSEEGAFESVAFNALELDIMV